MTIHPMAPGSALTPAHQAGFPTPRLGRRHLPPSAALHRAQGGYLPLEGEYLSLYGGSTHGEGVSAPGGDICPWAGHCSWGDVPFGGTSTPGGQFSPGGGGVTCPWGRGITPPSCPHICPPKPLICPMAPICPQPHSHPSTGAGGRDLQGQWPHRARLQLLVNHCYPLRVD